MEKKQELEGEYADLMGMKNMEMADLRAPVKTLEWESIKARSAHSKDVEEERKRSREDAAHYGLLDPKIPY